MSQLVTASTTDQAWATIKDQAHTLVASRLLPESIKTAEAAMAVIIKGRELGLPPMVSFSNIHIIKGKPTISAELMLALIYRNCPQAYIRFVRYDVNACEIDAARPGMEPSRFNFSIEDAKRAGLTGNPTWQKFPKDMCKARCISAMARSLFPDILMGCSYTPEEMAPEAATVDHEGAVCIEGVYDVSSRDRVDEPRADPKSDQAGTASKSNPAAAKRTITFDKGNERHMERLMGRIVAHGFDPGVCLDLSCELQEKLHGKEITGLDIEALILAAIEPHEEEKSDAS